ERALALGAFLNGVYFVPLAEIDSTDLLVAAIANACEFAFSGKADLKTQLANFLCEKEILLLLDNFDHLLDAATWLSELQKRAPSVKFLITSRERLNVQAEWLIALDGLDAPTAAQLFIERARQVRGDFALSEEERAHIARVCELVEGLPLGIELAAAWASTHSFAEIARELERGFDFLATTRRDAPERQRSLRAVFEHAWHLLEPDARTVFARLSVFRGGFARAASERIARASLATLTALVDKSLVRRDSAGRFSLHPILAQYAEEKLDAARASIGEVHRDYFADWMMQCATRLHSVDECATIAEMNAEIENVRAAWWHAVNAAQPDLLLKFVPGLYRLYDLQSRYREGEELFGKAVDALGGVSSDARGIVAAKILARQAALWIDVGQATRAAETLARCLELFRQLNETAEILFCLKNLGNAARVTGKYAEGKIFYSELLEVGRAHNARAEVAVALNNLGILANSAANFPEAKRLHRECLELRRAMGERAAMASTLLNLGVVHTDLGEYDDAEPLIRQAMEICNEFGDRRRLAATNTNLGSILSHRGRDVEAKELYAHALALHRETGYRLGIAVALNNVGTAAFRLGDDREADAYLRSALAEAQESKFDFVALDALVWFAALQSKTGKSEFAAELLALVLHHPASDNESLTTARKHFAELARELPRDVIARAEERGCARQLEQVVAEILRAK
ncbi:MAG: tetratricopeptide repeat protein, partial [Chloroflexi bacterium]|nr:tetratricopeptide repeat protein [Chloroflexota bacterium]